MFITFDMNRKSSAGYILSYLNIRKCLLLSILFLDYPCFFPDSNMTLLRILSKIILMEFIFYVRGKVNVEL